MEEYGSYNWNQQGNEPQNNTPMEPKKQPRKRNGNGARWAKKIGAVALSAVLFGGVAGGVFTGVTYATGATAKAQSTQTDSSKQETTKTTLQTTTSSGSTGSSASGQSLDVSSIAKNAMPSIVAITNKSVQEVQDYFSMFSRGSGTQEQEVESQGSGIIIGQNDSELLIATNNHVVEDADTLSVCFVDDQAYEATVKGTDADNDLAVIAVKLSDISDDTMSQIKIAEIGDSDKLVVGQQVVAIGNALGYGQNVTSGIISALNRPITIDNFSKEVIVTDAAINFGNSGGALLNAKGEVIGINVAKEAGEGSDSIGYAIPIDTAIPILNELVNRETRDQLSNSERGYIGATVVDVSDDAKDLYDMPQGAFVYEVSEGSAAEQAGIHKGDIITKFEGISVTDKEDLIDQMSYYKVGETVTLEVQSATNGSYEAREVEVTLQQGAASATDDFGQSQQPDGSDSWGNQDDQGELPENPFADGGLYEGNGTF